MNFIIYDTKTPISDTAFEEIYSILSSSLPQTEMRSKEAQKAITKKDDYKLLAAYDNNEIVGFMAIWDLVAYNFIEHFAVKSYFRGNGIGSKIIKYFLNLSTKPVILEVELPESTPFATRRIEFYKRQGFNLNNYEYFQPPLQDGFPLLPLRLMSYPEPLEYTDFLDARQTLYTNIYGFFEKRLD